MKLNKRTVFTLIAALFALALAVYTWLVTPRRFVRCLPEPINYFTRSFSRQHAAELPEFTSASHLRLLVNGNEALPVMLEAINSAQKNIRWQVMLFDPDSIGTEMASALADAARRGVQVQLSFNIDQTVNGTIANQFPREQQERRQRIMDRNLQHMREAGVEVRANPAGIDFPLENVAAPARDIQQDIANHSCISANHYDHRKLLIIDDRLAFIGGMNAGEPYLYHIAPLPLADMQAETASRLQQGQPEAWDKWFDTAVQVEGPVVTQIAEEFNWKWQVLGGQPLPAAPTAPETGEVAVQFLVQRPGNPQIGARFFELVDHAQQEIWVASPFVSYDPALDALMAASQRGVRVVFVHPNRHNEMQLSNRIYRQRVNDLIAAGVEVYFNDLRMAHTKLLVVDGRYTMIGSFNLNHRSFRHDLEDVLLVDDPAFAQDVINRVFASYLTLSQPVLRPIPSRWDFIDWIIKPFS